MEVLTETVTAKDTQIDITVTVPEAESKPEFKSFAIQASEAKLDENEFEGEPSIMGNIDDGNDVIFPGAFDGDVIPQFLRHGFVPVGHEWYDLPRGYPIAAEAKGRKLSAKARFHSTQAAQDARTVVKERLENGLTVGLSIGFDIAPGGAKVFDSGEKLLEHAAELKADMSLLDVATIKAHKGFIRAITKIGRLFEFSIVPVPMNRLAGATAAKATVLATEDFAKLVKVADFEEFLRDVGFSGKAAKQFIAQLAVLKGIDLPRDVGGDAPQPDTKGDETPPEEPVVTPTPAKPAPKERLLWTQDGRLVKCPL